MSSKSNAYWGGKAGIIHPQYGPIIKGKRGAARSSGKPAGGNQGPTGKRKTRWYQTRAFQPRKGH